MNLPFVLNRGAVETLISNGSPVRVRASISTPSTRWPRRKERRMGQSWVQLAVRNTSMQRLPSTSLEL